LSKIDWGPLTLWWCVWEYGWYPLCCLGWCWQEPNSLTARS